MVVYTTDRRAIKKAEVLRRIFDIDVKIANEFKDGEVYKIIIKKIKPQLIGAVNFIYQIGR